MPTERKQFSIFDPRAKGIIQKLGRGQTSKRIERDEKYEGLAFSEHAFVVPLLCDNWLRDPVTGMRGKPLPKTELVHMYDKRVDGGEYKQAFWIIMWTLRCADRTLDSAKWAYLKYRLIRKSALWFDRTQQQDKQAWLYERAHQFETEGSFLRPWLFAIGAPIESEKYGTGPLLRRLEATVKMGKGGISEARTSLGSINLPDSGS